MNVEPTQPTATEKLTAFLRYPRRRALADAYFVVLHGGLSGAVRQGALTEPDVEALRDADFVRRIGGQDELTFDGQMALYALAAWAGQQEAPRDFIRDHLPDLTGRRLLDVGCGEAATLVHALERGASFAVGIDNLAVMVRLARGLIEAEDPSADGTWSVMQAVAESLPFADERFDVITCRLAFGFFDLRLAVPELMRVLAPQGQLLVSVNTPTYYARRLLRWPPRSVGEALVATANAIPTFFGGGAHEFVFRDRKSRTVGMTLTALRRWLAPYGLVPARVAYESPASDDLRGIGRLRGTALHAIFQRALPRR